MIMNKVRLRLTIFSAGITTLILIIMTLGYLYIFEKNLISYREYAYQSDIYSIASNLEQQNVISSSWLSQLESSKNCYVSVFDNGSEFLFNNQSQDTVRTQILTDAWNYYSQNKDTLQKNDISYKSSYISYSYAQNKQSYNCFVILLTQSGATLEMLLVMPFKNMQNRLSGQRVVFFVIIMAAIIAIWLFAWIFTGKMLRPIEENRIKQKQFVAAASHELRTPLAVILSSAEAVQNKLNDASVQHDISTIHDETIRYRIY